MPAADRIEQLERVIREARETPLLGGAMVDDIEADTLIGEIRADLFDSARELPDGRWVVKGEATLQAAGELERLLSSASRIPLRGRVRVDRERAMALVTRMRDGVLQERIADEPPMPPWDPAPMLALIDRLDAAIQGAKPVPLTSQVRVNGDEIYDILDEMRVKVPEIAYRAPDEIKFAVGDLLVPIDTLDDLIHNAAPVPLTDQVRIERQEAAGIVQTMRAAFSQGTSAAPTN